MQYLATLIYYVHNIDSFTIAFRIHFDYVSCIVAITAYHFTYEVKLKV